VLQCYYPDLPAPVLLPVVVPDLMLFPLALLFARWVHRRGPPWAALLAFPVAWTACEYLIGLLSPHGSYGSLAYSQVSTPLLTQSAALFGLHSITFMICLCAASVAMTLRGPRQTWPAVALGLGICALDVVVGLVRLNLPPAATVGVAAIVDESALGPAWHQRTLAAAVNVSETYARAIGTAAAQGARFVVTPEGGIIIPKPEWRGAVLAPLVEASRQTGTQIIAGISEEPPADLAVSIEPDGTLQTYAKRHLIPILESQFTPGRAAGLLRQGRAMAVCKDMDFPGTIRHDAANDIRLMGVPAWDFVKDAWLHGRMAVLRGVENGFALVRAANQGLVTVSDAQGRMIARRIVAASGTTLVVARVPLGGGPTLYTRIGDVLPWLCVLLTALLVLLPVALGRHRTAAGAAGVTDGRTAMSAGG
jgi:apolipoprotein N-acyltransferase